MKRQNYALIGDLHSQLEPLTQVIQYCHEHNLTPVFLGDVFDSRCSTSDSVAIYDVLRFAQRNMGAVILRSNHQDKLERYLKNHSIVLSAELVQTLNDFAESSVSPDEVLGWLDSMPYVFCFRDSKGQEYRCSHAMVPSWLEIPEYEESVEIHDVTKRVKQLCMYGDFHEGERKFWWERDTKREWIRVAGHYHVVHTSDKNLVLDGGCGGHQRSWFCQEPPVLVLYDVEKKERVEFTQRTLLSTQAS